MEFEPIKIDDTQNTLIIRCGDTDGFMICEENQTNEIYVYYSDIESTITALNHIKDLYERNQHSQDTQQHIHSSKKNGKTTNIYKPIEKNKRNNEVGWVDG